MNPTEKELKKLGRKHLLQGRELAAIGRMEHVESIHKALKSHGMRLSVILDNDTKKEGLSINGVLVYKPEKYLLPFRENILILIHSPKYWRDIGRQFQGMGYVEGKHFIVLHKPSIKKAIEDVEKGDRIYRRICKKYGADVHVLVARGPIGDFYLLALYLDAYIKKEGIRNYVLAGDSKGFTKIADLFGIQPEDMILLSEEETDCLIQAYTFAGKGRYRVHLLTVWQRLSFNSCMVKYRQGFTFMDTICAFAYGLPREEPPFTPLFDKPGEEMDALCMEMGMEKGRTAVLSPYAYSLQSLPMHFWQRLADRLAGEGYVVCVNIDGKKETCRLEGVIPVNFSFKQSKAVLEYAGCLIGIRSGFMDITSSARCRRFVLYPEYIKENVVNQWHRTDLEFCGLVHMGLCQDAVELEYPLKDEEGNPYIKEGRYDAGKEEEIIDFIMGRL